MIVVMTLLVRDEADIVAATIEHHLAAGVDFIIATDNGSKDDTVKILDGYQGAGVLELHHEPTHVFRQSEWVTRMARRASTTFRADWVINGDADEFLWPADHVRDCLAATPFSSLRVPRDNLVADPERSAGSWPHRLTIRDTRSLTSRGQRIGPKVIHVGDPEVTVSHGNHSVTGPRIIDLTDEHPLRMLHVPARDAEQYQRKIRNGATAVAANTELDPAICWHWRDAYRNLEDAATTSETDQAGRELLTTGDLERDTRLRDRLLYLLDRAVRPDQLERVFGGGHSES